MGIVLLLCAGILAADFIAGTSNMQLPNALVSVHADGQNVTTSKLAPLQLEETNTAAFSAKRRVLYVMIRESNTEMALTIVGYDTTGKVVHKVPMVDKSLGSFYAIFFDDEQDDIKCILFENATAAFSVDVDTGIHKHQADLKPENAAFEISGSSFDQTTGKLYQLEAVLGIISLYTVDTRSASPSVSRQVTHLTAGVNFYSAVFSPSAGKMLGFRDDNKLAAIDVNTGAVTNIGRPVAKGTVDFSSNHVALDDAAGVVYTTITPDSAAAAAAAAAAGSGSGSGSVGLGLGLTHFIGVNVTTGAVVLKHLVASPLMFLHFVPPAAPPS